MQKITLSLFLVAMTFLACNEAIKKPAATTDTAPVAAAPTPAAPSKTTCYALRFKKDVTAIEMTVTGNDVTGLYAREIYEKDGAHGTFKGTIAGDLVTVTNTFMIEGNVETAEMVFKMVGDKLMEGQGELEGKDGHMMFKDKSKLRFEETLAPVDCASIQAPIATAKQMAEMIAKQPK